MIRNFLVINLKCVSLIQLLSSDHPYLLSLVSTDINNFFLNIYIYTLLTFKQKKVKQSIIDAQLHSEIMICFLFVISINLKRRV